MNDSIKSLCDDLCSEAGLSKDDLLSGALREISRAELLAVAQAYESRISYYNFELQTHIRKPMLASNVKKVWTATFGKYWGLELKKRIKHKQPVFFINHGVR